MLTALVPDAERVAEEDEPSQPATVRAVKMKLATFCTAGKKLTSQIESLALRTNRLLGEAYAFSNFHILRLMTHNAGSLGKGETAIPKIDRSFFYRCLIAVSQSNAMPATLGDAFKTSVEQFDKLRSGTSMVKTDIREWKQLVAELSIIMATMATNHLIVNLEPRLKAYLRWKYPQLKGLWSCIANAVLLEPKKPIPSLFKRYIKRSKCGEAMQIATDLRLTLPLKGKKIFASIAHTTLPTYFTMLKDTEVELARRAAEPVPPPGEKIKRLPRCRTFSLLPLKGGYTMSNIPISGPTLLKLLRAAKLTNFKGDGQQITDFTPYWRKHFNLNAVETSTQTFRGCVTTDGYAVSVLINGLSNANPPSPGAFVPPSTEDIKSGKALVNGIDPGFSDVFTATNNQGKTVHYSSAQYYHDAYFNHSARRTKRWNTDTDKLVTAIPSGNTAILSSFKIHVRAYILALPRLLEHRRTKGYRRMRFLRFVMRQKAIKKMCDIIAPPDEITYVGFGDWSGGGRSPISRRTSGPLNAIKRELQSRDNVRFDLTDEHLTSVTCHGCGQRLINMKAKSTKYKNIGDGKKEKYVTHSRVHKVLHCKNSDSRSSGRCGTTWNRDVNASKNILLITIAKLTGVDRPAQFCRAVTSNKTMYGVRREEKDTDPTLSTRVIRTTTIPQGIDTENEC